MMVDSEEKLVKFSSSIYSNVGELCEDGINYGDNFTGDMELLDDDEDSSTNPSLVHLHNFLNRQGDDGETCYRLPKLIMDLTIAILQEAIDQLVILRKMKDHKAAGRINLGLNFISLLERFEKKEFDNRDLDAPSGDMEINQAKIEKDRQFLEKILEYTVDNLKKEEGNFSGLIKIVENFLKWADEEDNLMKSVRFEKLKMAKLRKAVEDEREKFLKDIQAVVLTIGNLQDQIMDALYINEAKLDYVTDWESARNELHNHILNGKENAMTITIKQNLSQMVRENRVHGEIMAYYNELLADQEAAIIRWNQDYSQHMDEKDFEIQKKIVELDNQKQEYEELKVQYETRTVEINEFLEYKRIKKQEAEERELQRQAATQIQAWWRGTMYRRGLGPYKKKKGKGKGKGKKGSGDKNKPKKKLE